MIGIIGAGNMGRAIALGINKKILISDVKTRQLSAIKSRCILTAKDNIDLTKRSSIIILCIKPQHIVKVLKEIAPFLKRKLVISIAAGIETSLIEKIIGKKASVIRVMPNMPLQVGRGISAIARGRFTGKKDPDKACRIFSKMGEVIEVKEHFMDAVTAVSGSGPAYYFLFTDILEASARSVGLKKDLARKLAIATFIGSAASANAARISMKDFVKKIASKGGTTEAALKVFKKKHLEGIIKQAVRAANNRSRYLKEVASKSLGG